MTIRTYNISLCRESDPRVGLKLPCIRDRGGCCITLLDRKKGGFKEI